VGRLAVDAQHRGLADRVDAGVKRLHHRRPLAAANRLDQLERKPVRSGAEPPRVAAAGRDRRLDDDLAVELSERIARTDEPGLDDRDPGGPEVPQVSLVGVPADERGAVVKGRPDRVAPAHELIPPPRVVPGRADHHRVEAPPLGVLIVP
jgi:hypothetical protein